MCGRQPSTRVSSKIQRLVFRMTGLQCTTVPFGVTYEKIGTIQRRLAWPLHKDDTLSRSGRPTGLNIYASSFGRCNVLRSRIMMAAKWRATRKLPRRARWSSDTQKNRVNSIRIRDEWKYSHSALASSHGQPPKRAPSAVVRMRYAHSSPSFGWGGYVFACTRQRSARLMYVGPASSTISDDNIHNGSRNLNMPALA
ncbi:hypothetical protein C8Q78DRAFT_483777 [Trametes maxima]|nr:hypothetical protein C8Q78DRAFT_483777 [Trametes maxima]